MTLRLTPLDMGKEELRNARIQNLAAAPGTPVTGQLYYDTGTNKLFFWNGTSWEASGAAADASETVKGIVELSLANGTEIGGGRAVQDSDVRLLTPTQKTDLTDAGDSGLHFHATDRARANHTGTQTASTVSDFDTAVRLSRLDQMAIPTASVAMNSQKITGLLDPTNAQDAATKTYVDGLANGVDWKTSVRAATTTLGVLATAFANGSTIDGVVLATGNRILIKDQTLGQENGLYTVNASGAPTRATDADVSAEVTGGMAVWVNEGTINADTGWVLTTNDAITLGTTVLVFAQFTGLGTVTAGTGLTKTGNTLDVGAGTGILANANDVAVDPAVVVRKFSADCAAATSTTVTHNFNTRDVTVSVYLNSGTYEEVMCDIEHSTVNTVIVRFTVAPAAAAYRIVVHS